jgi:exopolysaccharide production protein ExoZ
LTSISTGSVSTSATVNPPALAPDSHQSTTIISVQVLRFIAAFAVTLYHAHGAIRMHGGVPSEAAYGGPWELGASGVHIFFVISGFVMVLTSTRHGKAIGPLTFLTRRFLRIYPIYWIAATVYLVVHWFMSTPYSLTLWQTLGAYGLYAAHAALIIGPGWTLAYEVYFYLCFALSLILGSVRGLFALTLFFLASVAAGMVVPAVREAFPIATNGLLLEFILGCWIGFVALTNRDRLRWVGAPGLVLGTALLIGSNFLPVHIPTVLAWGIPSALIVAGAISIEPRFRRPLPLKIALLGDSSYLLYLSHILLIDVMAVLILPATALSTAMVAVATIGFALACVAIAHGAHLLVEAPMLKALNRFVKRRTLPADRQAPARI